MKTEKSQSFIRRDRASLIWWWAIGALVAAGFVAHTVLYGFITDDAYIAFVYSRNLAEHGALVFNVGHPPVEGYTSFLWTVLLGIGALLGISIPLLSLILGGAFAVATLCAVARWFANVNGQPSLADWCASALMASTASFACWASGGLETQMFVFLVIVALVQYSSVDATHLWRVGVFLGLAALTRPEGLLLAGVVVLHRYLSNVFGEGRWVPNRNEWLAAATFLGIFLPWLAWRWWYYGFPLPNTYYAKAAGVASDEYQTKLLQQGRYYLKQWAIATHLFFAIPFFIFGLWSAAKELRARRFVVAGGVFVLLYVLYAASVGGDFMGLYRFVLPAFCVAVVISVFGLLSMLRRLHLPQWAIAIVLFIVLASHGIFQARVTAKSIPRWRHCGLDDASCLDREGKPFWSADQGIDTPSYLAVYAHDRKRVGQHMASCLREDDFSIFGGVGAKPYFSRGKGVDVFGLVSARVAHEVPRTRPRPGHNKWASDPKLYEWYQPSFVFHCYSLHRDFKRPRLNCNPHFWKRKGYRQVTLHVPGLVERGSYYTFFVAGERYQTFVDECHGVVR